MPRWPDPDDHDLDEDDDYPDEDEEEPTIPCPYCRAEIHEDPQRCPECGKYISREDAPATWKPWWIYVGVAACLYVVFRWMF